MQRDASQDVSRRYRQTRMWVEAPARTSVSSGSSTHLVSEGDTGIHPLITPFSLWGLKFLFLQAVDSFLKAQPKLGGVRSTSSLNHPGLWGSGCFLPLSSAG